VNIGALTLQPLEARVATKGETASGHASVGKGVLYELTGSDNLRLTVRDTRWANGERDVVACERHESPERFDTLVDRMRLSVLDHGGLYVELRQARVRSNGHAGLYNASATDLDDGAGVGVRATLLAQCAVQVATREELLGDKGSTRFRMGARFTDEDSLVPLVAYVLTRVCPIASGLSA
jgi:hypothetical protein